MDQEPLVKVNLKLSKANQELRADVARLRTALDTAATLAGAADEVCMDYWNRGKQDEGAMRRLSAALDAYDAARAGLGAGEGKTK